MGVSIRSNVDGENGIKVWLEFVPKGEQKNFTYVQVAISAGEKGLVAAPLLTSHPTPERVSVYFSSDAANLSVSVLTIVVEDGERTRIGYQLKLKDFIGLEKIRLHATESRATTCEPIRFTVAEFSAARRRQTACTNS